VSIQARFLHIVCLFNALGSKVTCRVEPWCSGFRIRWFIHGIPRGPQTDIHTLFPSAPSSNRKSGFPRYGSPTTFPMCLSVTVAVDVQILNRTGIIPVDQLNCLGLSYKGASLNNIRTVIQPDPAHIVAGLLDAQVAFRYGSSLKKQVLIKF
jgi:hypothetical protein